MNKVPYWSLNQVKLSLAALSFFSLRKIIKKSFCSKDIQDAFCACYE